MARIGRAEIEARDVAAGEELAMKWPEAIIFVALDSGKAERVKIRERFGVVTVDLGWRSSRGRREGMQFSHSHAEIDSLEGSAERIARRELSLAYNQRFTRAVQRLGAFTAPEAAAEILREKYPDGIVEALVSGADRALCDLAWPNPSPSEIADLRKIDAMELHGLGPEDMVDDIPYPPDG